MLRLAVNRRAFLGVKPHLGPKTRFFINVRELWVWYGAPFLMTWRVCNLQLLLGLASAVIHDSEPLGTHDNIFSDSRPPQFIGRVPVIIYPRNRVTQLYTQALRSLLVAFYDSHGCNGSIRPSARTARKILLIYFVFSRCRGKAFHRALP
jgi:hypothetical protein